MRVLIIAHGHPSIHKGGGEVAAYSMYKMLRDAGHQAIFLGWSGFTESPNRGALKEIGDNDYLLYTKSEFFHFSSTSVNLKKALEALIVNYKPDVVHLHHYIHVGIEAAAIVKELSPKTKVIMTLHEYLAICANNGQLFNKEGKVCPGYTPELCNKCFPESSPSAFFMRELAIKSALSFVDYFISPSEFLRQQYILWGIPSEKIDAIENPLPLSTSKKIIDIEPPNKEEFWQLGFFGQINYYKGLDIIIDGIHHALSRGVKVKIGIHGSMSAVTGQQYIDDLQSNIEALGENAKFHGAYQQSNVQQLMSQYHFIVMGSRWYENSPVVIQEAIAAGRPLIVPSHGGMLEKTEGLSMNFLPSDPIDFSNCLLNINQHRYISIKNEVLKIRTQMDLLLKSCFSKTLEIYLK